MAERVSDEELAAELLWHIKFDDDDHQLPCDVCGNDEVPCPFEACVLDLCDARQRIAELEALIAQADLALSSINRMKGVLHTP